MTDEDLASLEREVAGDPRGVGARLRLGHALLSAGRQEEGADQLRLAAQLDPANPHVAILAVTALARCGRERDAALLLSTRIAPAGTSTVLTEGELAAMVQLLTDPRALVRCHAARAVGRLRVHQASDALELACADDNAAVRLAASGSLRLLRAH